MARQKVLFLGIDGMDPVLAEEMMGRGELENFARLAERGSYLRLRTTDPPQSPVAWTSMATGEGPGGHGVYDFLKRFPGEYVPRLSVLELRGSGYVSPIRARTFWERASENRIPSVVLKWPLTFPPQRAVGGLRLLAGLGVPDIQGKLGAYTFYTTDRSLEPGGKKGRIVHMDVKGGQIEAEIPGPLKATFGGEKEVKARLVAEVSENGVVMLAGKSKVEIAPGAWSGWVPLSFRLGLGRSVKGIARFYLKSTRPEFSLYMTPVHIALSSRAFPISEPRGYARKLSAEIGPYATLGMPEDTNAFNEGLIDEPAFLGLCDMLAEERRRMFMHELVRFKEGVLACVFDTTDRVQHMFWRFLDPAYTARNPELAENFSGTIAEYYRRMDAILGEALSRISDDTLLLICSDHGFRPFRRSVHINTWLIKNGFMSLKDGAASCEALFQNVDWPSTRAYSLGLNSLYLNLRGREKYGVLGEDAASAAKRELIAGLEALEDEGKKVLLNAHDSSALYSGPFAGEAPDIVLGYSEGYRQSWQTAVGGAPGGHVIVENQKKWSGDHCCDSSLVPGVFFSNHKFPAAGVSVTDISGLITEYLGI